ncbi:MAG TPA: Hsp20/alpha crystallin family protein [Polyangia bacterium]|jgi:HSP20 family protein
MHPTTLQLMHDHVRAIHLALTGDELPKTQTPAGEAPPEAALGEVATRFFALEALARQLPTVAERVPQFSFAPPFDLLGTARELLIEVGVPGIEREDVEVEQRGTTLVVSGCRGQERPSDGRAYYHAELPRGPFRRVVVLPDAVVGEPRVEVERGLIRIRLSRAAHTPPATA